MRAQMPTGENITDFAPPQGWVDARDGVCYHLWVRVDKYDTINDHISHWRPNAEELAALNAGGVIQLSCLGLQPPVRLDIVEGRPMGEPDGFDTR